MINDIRDAVAALDSRMEQRFQALESRILSLEARMNDGFQAADGKMTRYFTWLIGLYVTGLIAILVTR